MAFCNRFGLEGLVTFKRDNEYDAETYEITVPDKDGDKVKIGVFDKVVVEIVVEKVSLLYYITCLEEFKADIEVVE